MAGKKSKKPNIQGKKKPDNIIELPKQLQQDIDESDFDIDDLDILSMPIPDEFLADLTAADLEEINASMKHMIDLLGGNAEQQFETLEDLQAYVHPHVDNDELEIPFEELTADELFLMANTIALMEQITAGQTFATEEEKEAFVQAHIEEHGYPRFPILPPPLFLLDDMDMDDYGYVAETELDHAQDLCYQAFETNNKRKQVKLAKQALEISPDCADAYYILSQHTKTPEEAVDLLTQAVEAGERAIGEDFEELRGHFWGFLETRPYMRSKLQLVIVLIEQGKLQESVEHMQMMLDLNPNDNQGVRYLLLPILQKLDDTKAVDKLLKAYDGDWSAAWKYGGALHEFKKKGKSAKAKRLLKDAIENNTHVPVYLLGKKKLPKQITVPFVSPGADSEALDYLRDSYSLWQETEGAIDWLAEIYADVK